MATVFVDRGAGNAIVGVYQAAQSPGQESISDSHADVIAFFDKLNPASPASNILARTQAKAILASAPDAINKLIRAVCFTLLDELNTLRQWLAAFKAEVAAAANLADLKTRVAALPPMPDRTLAQARTAIQNKLDAGSAD